MFEESRREILFRWHLYRRWKNKAARRAEVQFHRLLAAHPKNSVFVDLGANVGNVSAAALEHGMRVYAIEPDPDALSHLYARFTGNPHVEIIPKAAGSKPGKANFYTRPDGNTEYSSLIRHDGNLGDVHEVEVMDIVEFLRPIVPVAVLKMDIEGAEVDCLGAILDAGLDDQIGAILVETHERFSPDIAEGIGALKRRIADENITNIDMSWV